LVSHQYVYDSEGLPPSKLFRLALAISLPVKCPTTTCKVSVNAFFFPDDLSMTPYRCPPPPPTRVTRKRRTNKLRCCYLPLCLFCTLARYSLPSRTAPFTYVCLSAQVSRGETRVHAGRWHAGRSLKRARAFPPYSLERTNTRMWMGLSCLEASSERACKTDTMAGSSNEACLSAASW